MTRDAQRAGIHSHECGSSALTDPTTGTLELVDLDRVHATDITMDQAARFVVSGATLSPDRFAEQVFVGKPGTPAT